MLSPLPVSNMRGDISSSYFFYDNLIYLPFQLLNSFLLRQNVGVEDRFPQRPHFLQLYNLLLLFDMAIPNCCEILPHHGVQCFLVDTVGATIAFPVSMVAPAHIFPPLVSTPVADHGNKGVPAFPAGQKYGGAGCGFGPGGGALLLR